jgi:transposase
MRQFGTQISGNRRPDAELNKEQRSAILYALELGQSPTKIAEDLRVSRRTIYRTRDRFQQRADLDSRPRSGRPKVFTQSTCRYIFRLARRNPWWSYRTLSANAPGNPSRDTIRRILKVYDLRKYKVRRRIPLNSITARKRRRFARLWEGYRSWEKVIFSDECSIQRRSNSKDQWVFRFWSEAYRRDLVNLKPHVKDVSQMVWAGIWIGGRTKLVIMERDSDSVRNGYTTQSYLNALEEGFIEHYEPGTIFQQDNAKIHKSYVAREWFERHGVEVMEWPPHSPDLNPIEPVWRLLKLKLFELHPELVDMGQSEGDWDFFKACMCEAWDALDQRKIDSLISSVPRRIAAVKRAKGYYTRY